MKRFSVICLLSLVLTSGAYATTWYINPGGTGDAPTIQAGIDSAAVGDTVEVACGTYVEYEIVMKSGLVLRSATGDPACVTIDATNMTLGGGFQFLSCDSTTVMEGFTLTNGHRYYNAGNTYINSGAPRIRHCRFTGNRCGLSGGAVHAENHATPVIESCIFDNNLADNRGGAISVQDTDSFIIQDCVIFDNVTTYQYGGAVYIRNASGVSISGCTMVYNQSYLGCVAVDAATATVDHSILAFNGPSEAVRCFAGGSISFTCSDLFGNAGGDWGGCAGSAGVNGNFSVDPWFCDAPARDFSLDAYSPCLVGACGQVGALGSGCIGGEPTLLSLTDVLDDQGRRVRLRWERSQYDIPGDPDVVGYEVYRRQDARAHNGPVSDVEFASNAPGGLRLDGWDYVETVPAHGDSVYQLVAPTLCDSTGSGICWSVFFVRATTPDVFTYFDSPPDSGYSVDNLAPAVPGGLQLATTTLTWDECPDADFDYFTVYGSDTGNIASAVLIGYTVAPTMSVQPSPYSWYHVTATDFAGNEGGDAAVENTAVAAGTLHVVPAEYDLQVRPSPFGDRTTVAIDVPRSGHATLRIYDVAGHLVRVLVDGPIDPGRHSLSWNGRDSSGRPVSAGVYLLRFETTDFLATRKVVRLN